MNNTFTVTLPWLNMKLSTNSVFSAINACGFKPKIARGVAHSLTQLKKEKVEMGKDAAKSAMETQSVEWILDTIKRGEEVDVHIVFTPPSRVKRDYDNMTTALKSTLDGVAEALGVDDYYMRPIAWRNAPEGKDNARVDIYIMPMNEERPFAV